MIAQQAERWADETVARAARFRTGFAGAWDWLTGKSRKIAKENEEEAYQAIKRNDREREDQRQEQLAERRALQTELTELKSKHSEEVAALKSDVADYLGLGSDHDHLPRDSDQSLESSDLIGDTDKHRPDFDHDLS